MMITVSNNIMVSLSYLVLFVEKRSRFVRSFVLGRRDIKEGFSKSKILRNSISNFAGPTKEINPVLNFEPVSI